MPSSVVPRHPLWSILLNIQALLNSDISNAFSSLERFVAWRLSAKWRFSGPANPRPQSTFPRSRTVILRRLEDPCSGRHMVANGSVYIGKHRCSMTETQLLAELAQSCRLLACHQKNPNVLDMLHDLEEDFIQKGKDIESGKRHSDPVQPRQDGERLQASSTLRSS
jgi:hypothetical protein